MEYNTQIIIFYSSCHWSPATPMSYEIPKKEKKNLKKLEEKEYEIKRKKKKMKLKDEEVEKEKR